MTIEIKVPALPESVADAEVGTWHAQPGDFVERGDNILDLETDKVVLEVPAPESGVLKMILKPQGETVVAEDVLASFEPGGAAASSEKTAEKPSETAPKAPAQDSPAVRRIAGANDVDTSKIKGSGKSGRVTANDVKSAVTTPSGMSDGPRPEKRVKMPRLRQRVAERLLEVKQNTAMLTTFNDVDMTAVMGLRARYKESFEKQHNIRLGFMSFFTKAAVEALKRFPDVNASIDGTDIVFHGFYDVGMAVSTERGLVVPVVRNADQLSMAGIEQAITEYAGKARDGSLAIEDMTGGTFTITNGGVFGSMLSTPILNPPQSAILGLHKIEKRAVVVNDEIVIRPMMYLALSYDHRIIDGKQSVLFLKTIKELIEDPTRLILSV
jgi:2-oxoglutarate dehydrogenase E2 component (dihydrolipoamide succinyltransferase)